MTRSYIVVVDTAKPSPRFQAFRSAALAKRRSSGRVAALRPLGSPRPRLQVPPGWRWDGDTLWWPSDPTAPNPTFDRAAIAVARDADGSVFAVRYPPSHFEGVTINPPPEAVAFFEGLEPRG
jgi:hypothetical protein